jgi:hypothetical protein
MKNHFIIIAALCTLAVEHPAVAKDDPNLTEHYNDGETGFQAGKDIFNYFIAEKGQEIPDTPTGEERFRGWVYDQGKKLGKPTPTSSENHAVSNQVNTAADHSSRFGNAQDGDRDSGGASSGRLSPDEMPGPQ